MYWLINISREMKVCSRIRKRHWNYGNRQQLLDPVRRFHLGNEYCEGGDSKKSKFHYEAAAMAGHENARSNLGTMEAQSGNMERAVKHWMIAASAGDFKAMQSLLIAFNQGSTSRNAIDSMLTVYNNSCGEMRSEARDKYISKLKGTWGQDRA